MTGAERWVREAQEEKDAEWMLRFLEESGWPDCVRGHGRWSDRHEALSGAATALFWLAAFAAPVAIGLAVRFL